MTVHLADSWAFPSGISLAYPLALLAFSLGGVVSFLITPSTGNLARRLGILDHPDTDPQGRKQHQSATPYLGGAAIICGLLVGALALLGVPGGGVGTVVENIPPLLAVAVILGVIGLADDIRSLPRSFRVLAQVAAALLAWWAGFRVGLPFEPLNLPITVLWIIGITNAFNLLDNMDGLTSGVAGIAAFAFAIMGAANGLFIAPIVAAALSGSCFGFLRHNTHPAKIFMGDAGSMFIGFLLALIGLQLRFDNLLSVTFLVPVVVLAIPILDTALVVLSRIRNGRPVFLGGRDHVSHRLVAVGVPVREAVHLLYAGAIGLAWLGFVISRSTVEVGYMLLAFVVGLLLYVGSFLWRVPVYGDGVIPLHSTDSEGRREMGST